MNRVCLIALLAVGLGGCAELLPHSSSSSSPMSSPIASEVKVSAAPAPAAGKPLLPDADGLAPDEDDAREAHEASSGSSTGGAEPGMASFLPKLPAFPARARKRNAKHHPDAT
jgi:hypothetical protein